VTATQSTLGAGLHILSAVRPCLALEFARRALHSFRMISKHLALFLTLSLAGCCASGIGCNTPPPGGPVAWDGLGVPPTENAVGSDSASTASYPGKPKKVRPIATQADSNAQAHDKYGQEQAADQAADAKLTKQLKICGDC
jgi:hypothetical protein